MFNKVFGIGTKEFKNFQENGHATSYFNRMFALLNSDENIFKFDYSSFAQEMLEKIEDRYDVYFHLMMNNTSTLFGEDCISQRLEDFLFQSYNLYNFIQEGDKIFKNDFW